MSDRGIKIAVATAMALLISAGVQIATRQTSSTRAMVDAEALERQGKAALAKKILQIGSSGSMKEATYQESKKGSGQQVDKNSGNPFPSDTAYHSTTKTTCLEWTDASNTQCKPGKEIAPYISPHGMDGEEEASILERLVAKAYNASKDKKSETGGDYKIWEIQTRNGESFIDPETRGLDSEKITSWRIKEDLQNEIADEGYKSSLRELNKIKDLGKEFEVAAPPEVLRTMASRYTKILRNNLATKLGEYRAAQTGVEVVLNEDLYDGKEYAKEAKKNPAGEERAISQMPLSSQALAYSLEERLENAKKLKEAAIDLVNVKVEGGKITQANPNTEGFDAAANRINIALIDFVGIDPNELEKPGDVSFSKNDLAPMIGQFDQNGKRTLVNQTNREQLESYNGQLVEAARGMAEVASKFSGSTPYTNESIEKTLSYRIKPGSMNMVLLNGRTKAMDEDLKDTNIPNINVPDDQSIEQNLEVQPSQLTFSAAQ